MPTFLSRFLSRIIVPTLVATIACAVVAPNVTKVRAAGAGIIDYYATLNGSSYFQAPDAAAFDLTGNMTVEMWIRPSNVACMTSSTYCQLINKENSYEFGISGGKLEYALTNSSGSWAWYSTDAFLQANVWHHIAFVVSRSASTITVYYNGEKSGNTLSSTSVPATGSNSAGAFSIGNRQAYNETYTGDIDEVRLYSGTRSQANIRQDMYTYGTINAENLVAYYDFNENSATLVNDAPSAAAGTNLTRYNTVTYTDVKMVSNPTNLYNRTVITFPRSYITSSGGWTVPSGVTRVDALVVAGGGGGGGGWGSDGWSGGGGGAGGLRTLTNAVLTPGSALTVAVGGGGIRGQNGGSNEEVLGSNGAASILGSTSTVGGGYGGMSSLSAGSGGSGGGAGTYNGASTAGTGTTGEGNNGGAGLNVCCTAGGGGGAGGAGGAGSGTYETAVGGTAGPGVSNSISGTAVFYAAGGAGNAYKVSGSAGSSGGTATGASGSSGTGAGGGGGGGRADRSTWKTAGFGGSGAVIISYASPVAIDSTNRSMQFAGTSESRVTIPDNNLIDFGMDLTAEAWIYPTDTSCSGNKTFMGKENSYLFAVCNNFISFALRGISGITWRWYQTTIPVSINTWAHFAFVRSAGRLTIFKNGGIAAGGSEYTTTTGVPTDAFFNSSEVFTVGGRPSCSTECFTGYVDDVRLWNYPRSSSAIAQNYNKRIASNVVYLPFDESVGTTVANYANSTGSTLNGTSAGTTISSAFPTSVNSTYTASNVSGFLPGYDYYAGDAVTYSVTSNGTKGTATVSVSTGAFSYVANEGATGSDTFTYGVNGVNGTSTFTYTVSAPSQPMGSSKTFRQANDVAATLNTATSLGYNNPSTAYTLGETVRATLSVTNGTVNLTLNGTALISGALGSSTFTIDGTQSQINSALNSATVTATSAIPTRVTLDIGMKPADQTISSRTYTYNSNGHFYTRIAGSATSWTSSDTAAKAMSLGGRPGYLATIQSSGENSTAAAVNGANNSWIGTTDTDVDGTFRWKGNDTNSVFRIGVNNYAGRYNNWNSGEPNGGTTENYGMIRDNGTWNDCPNTCGTMGSIVEFDPVSSRTVTNLDFASSLAATAASARNLGLGTTFLPTSTWANGEIVRATFTASAGTIAYTAGSTTLVSGASGSSTVTFEGTVGNMNTALNSVTATPSATGASTVSFTYGVKRATTGSYIYNAVSDHFYLSNATTATYGATATNASNAKWAGTSGYPVTVTTESEYNTVRSINNVNSWSGGSDSVSEGQWEWNSPDAYQIFSDFDFGVGGAISYFDPSGEPNSSGNSMVVNFGTSLTYWDDAPESSSYAQIYEFAPIDTTLTYNITAGTALTITTPTTGLAATNGSAYSLTLATSGGAGTNVFSVASGSLPTGLGLDSSNGVISGTPSGALSANAITVSVTDANSATVTTSSFTISTTPAACVTSTTVVGNYTVEQVTTTGNCVWTVPSGVTSIDAFVVGGGGGGGADGGGGGGGGAYQPVAGYSVTPGDAINAGVGTGGSGASWTAARDATAGGTSSLTKNASVIASAGGGSGGGRGPAQAAGSGGTSTNGFAGGAGGAGSGGDGVAGGAGKAGASNYFLGTQTQYGGGGGGGSFNNGSYTLAVPAGTSGGGNGCGSPARTTNSNPAAGERGGGGGSGCAGNGGRMDGAAGGNGVILIRYATDPLDAFPALIGGLQARYTADDFQNLDTSRRSWVDSSNNGKNVVTFGGSPTLGSASTGSSKTVRAVGGPSTASATWPAIIASNASYTVFHVTKYNGSTRARILQSTTGNWLSGFYFGNTGVAYHNGWLTPNANNASASAWLLSSDQANLYRANGKDIGKAASGYSYSSTFAINAGINEFSDWQMAEMIVYNRDLTPGEIRQVESYLARTYGLLGLDATETSQGVLTPRTYSAAKKGTVSAGSTTQLDLTWTAPQDTTGVSGYKVEYKKTSDTTWTTFSASTSGTSVTVTGLTAGTAYDARVTPVDSGASNRPSALAAATTWDTSSIAMGTMPTNPSLSSTYSITANVTGPSSSLGTVKFMENGVTIPSCDAKLIFSGVATCSWSPAVYGSRNITATFSGDSSYLESTTASATVVSVDYGSCVTSSATTGRFTYLRVTQTGTCKISTLPSGVESVDVFIVGGGGGGGENVGSGGSGGGAYYAERVAATSSSSLLVTVGAGGRAGTYPADATTATALRDGGNGEASSISWSTNTFTGNGGIGGQTHWADNKCGGVGWTNTSTPGGTGSGSGGTASTGGIGGLDGSNTGVNASPGGSGYSNSITGLATNYGGGGGGGAWGGGSGAAGGNGGGGAGVNSGNGVSGTANTGGGGGGGTAGCTAGGASGTGIAIVRYANVPTITSQPAAVTKSSGQSHTFSVIPSATGAVSGDFTYQWRKDGINITGATSSTLALTNLVVADAGTYSVVTKSFGATGAVSTVTSSGAALTMSKGTQTITFGTIADRIYGVSPFALIASSSASLEVTLTSTTTGVCTLSGSTLTVASNGTCSITASQAGDVNYDPAANVIQSFVVATKTITITGMTATNKEYDRGTSATISLSSASLVGVQSGDTVTIDSSSATGAFSDKAVATGKTVTASGVALSGAHASRYNLTQPTALANISAKALTVSGITANNRDYNGSTSATSLLLTGSAALVGVISTDAVTLSTTNAAATFANKSVGAGKVVTITGLTISGGDAANYTLTQPTTTASIGIKTITVTGITANNRIYDGTTGATSLLITNSAVLAGVESGDTVTLSTTNAAGVFANKNVGTGKTITISGLTISGANAAEYTLTQPTTTASITTKELTVTGITANDRVYDSTDSATALLAKGLAVLVGKQGSDDVVLSTANAAATFANKNIGTSKSITIAGITISGTDSANYTLTQPTTSASITAAVLTVSGITATNRVYDGTVSATDLLVKTSAALVGRQGSDVVTLTHSAATATFANKNVGTNKPITIAGITIGGTDAANYTLTQPTTTASITA
ncbi:MAG: YDG domain-containing protein, partial [Ilumatobacteraceae bacterium]